MYNHNLLIQLPKLLGQTQKQMSDAMLMTRGSWQWITEHGDIKIKNLVLLCNHYHIHIDHFFREGVPYPIVDNSDKWKPIPWNPENIRSLWASRSCPYVQRKDLMDFIGIGSNIGRSTILRLTAQGSSLRATTWADICHHFNVDILLPFVSKEEIPNHIIKRMYRFEEEHNTIVAE